MAAVEFSLGFLGPVSNIFEIFLPIVGVNNLLIFRMYGKQGILSLWKENEFNGAACSGKILAC